MNSLYVIPVRQAGGLPVKLVFSPTSGFLQILPRGRHPCLRLYPSHYRADSGLSPVRCVRRQAHNKMRTGIHADSVSAGFLFLLEKRHNQVPAFIPDLQSDLQNWYSTSPTVMPSFTVYSQFTGIVSPRLMLTNEKRISEISFFMILRLHTCRALPAAHRLP